MDIKTAMTSLPYKRRIGQMLWIARSSRPDIAYQINALARVAHNPSKIHWNASTHVIRYLAHTRDMGLVYRKPDVMPTCQQALAFGATLLGRLTMVTGMTTMPAHQAHVLVATTMVPIYSYLGAPNSQQQNQNGQQRQNPPKTLLL